MGSSHRDNDGRFEHLRIMPNGHSAASEVSLVEDPKLAPDLIALIALR